MKVEPVATTVGVGKKAGLTGEQIIVYCARVSSPQNQGKHETGPNLLRSCLRRKHWSVFAQADLTMEIETSRAISAQILRHKSFDFQEFSQRYAEVTGCEIYEARRQDVKDRQNSIDDLEVDIKAWFKEAQRENNERALGLYRQAIDFGIAKECARFLLPMSTTTAIYMKGSVRSWVHYFQVRAHWTAQKEHRDVAEACWPAFKQWFPVVAEAMCGLEDYEHLARIG